MKDELIGTKIWVSGNGFKLLKTDNILHYMLLGLDVSNIELAKQEVTIIDKDKFMITDSRNINQLGDIFLIEKII